MTFSSLALMWLCIYEWHVCGLEDVCFSDGSWLFTKIEKQNAQSSTLLIKVKSIHHTKNDQAINVCSVESRQ